MTTAAEIVRRRRRQRRALLDIARTFAATIDRAIDLRAVVVFGSVARGDFNDDSDIDVLVIADTLPAAAPARLRALGLPPDRVEVVAWTPAEWRRELVRGNPIAVEAMSDGEWLVGSATAI